MDGIDSADELELDLFQRGKMASLTACYCVKEESESLCRSMSYVRRSISKSEESEKVVGQWTVQ